MGIHRDRGRRKKHHKPRGFVERADRWSEFEAWLEEDLRDSSGAKIGPSHSFSLKGFLQNSGMTDLEPDEKLRQLGIFWEDECAGMDQPGGWNILKRIYSTAIEYDPEYQSNYHSYSLSARACAWPLERDSTNWKAVLEDARGVCLTGIQKATINGMIWMSLGRIEYEFGDTVAALECFGESVQADNEQVMWAYLFRAHCLHDLGRWDEAVRAYREVDRSFFDGDLSWRAVLVRDQLAHSLAESGNSSESKAMFEKCFLQYEANPGLLEVPDYLEHACRLFPGKFALRGKELFLRDGFHASANKCNSLLAGL